MDLNAALREAPRRLNESVDGINYPEIFVNVDELPLETLSPVYAKVVESA